MKRTALVVTGLMLVAGCTTNIQNKDDTITAPKEPLGTFSQVSVTALTSNASKDEFSDAAVSHVQEELGKCMAASFQGVSAYNSTATAPDAPTLLVEPTILEGKKVSTGQRLLFGALAGSSAVLMEVKFTDQKTKEVIADPIFYSRAAAMSGAWTFGVQDNEMLTRLATNACNYVKQYR